MAASTHWYTTAFKNALTAAANSAWDWDTDTIKCSLHTSSYAVNQNTDLFWNTATNEVTSSGYTTGGITLTAAASVASNVAQFTASAITWTAVTFTTRYAVIYKSTGTSTTSPLIAYIDFGADQTVSGANFTITFDATGVIKATAS